MIILGRVLSAERKELIWKLYKKGLSLPIIAFKLNTTYSTVRCCLDKLLAQEELKAVQQEEVPYDVGQKVSPFGLRHAVYQLNYIDSICLKHTNPAKYAELMGVDVNARELQRLKIKAARAKLQHCIDNLNKIKSDKA